MKETWDKLWKNQNKNKSMFDKVLWTLRHNYSKAYANNIKSQLTSEPKKILEIGCGTATTLYYLKKIYPKAECFGVDISEEALKMARELNPEGKFEVGNAFNLQFKEEFDLVYSVGLLEHFSREDATKIYNEHKKAAKTGGLVSIIVPAKFSFINLARIISGKNWPFGYEDPFSRQDIKTLFEKTNDEQFNIDKINMSVYIAHVRKH